MEENISRFLGMIADGVASSGIGELENELTRLMEKEESNQEVIKELKREAETPGHESGGAAPDIEAVRSLLYDDIYGVCTNIRDHKFDILTRETMDQIIRFADSVNRDLKSGKVSHEAIVMLLDLLSFIHNLDGDPDNAVYMHQYFDRYLDFYNAVTYALIK